MSVAAIAAVSQAALATDADPERLIDDVAALDDAGPRQICFVEGRRYLAALRATRAGACIVPPALATEAPAGVAVLLSREPSRAFARVAAAFHPEPLPTGEVDPTLSLIHI